MGGISLDGEAIGAIGDRLHVFDVLPHAGTELRAQHYSARYGALAGLLDAVGPSAHLGCVDCWTDAAPAKADQLAVRRAHNAEGGRC